MKAELTCMYVKGSAIGYARFGTQLVAALTRRGFDVYDDMAQPEAPDHLARQVGDGRRHKKTNVALWCSTPGHARGWWTGQHTVLNSMWESNLLPDGYREHLAGFDQIIVPSQQNVELFSEFHPNVHLAYLGIDTDTWQYVPRQKPTARFNFLVAGTGARKGTDVAAKAFRLAFPRESWGDGPEPWLLMKNPKGEDFFGDRIEMVTGRISDEEEVALYARAHCMVTPSRGEGFGLQPLQAIAQGIPTILTDAHGHKAFSHLGYPVNSDMVESAYFVYGYAGQWWEPRLDDVIDWMRHIYADYDQAVEDAKVSSELAHRDFTWDRTADQVIAAIGMDRFTTPYKGNGTWFKPDHKLYPVMVLRPWTADIAGDIYHFEPGVTYYEMSDVKRILFEGQILDPRCLEHEQEGGFKDLGLSPEQVAQIGAYSARNSFCPTCSQKLNSGVTRADEIMAELEAR